MTARSRVQDSDVADRLLGVRSRIADAAARAGRSSADVTLVAVSKTVPAARVLEALRAGHADFGESRAQELRDKAPGVGEGVRWHFVGRLQRNKVKDVVGVADVVHSVDRDELAGELSARASGQGLVQRVLLQVNVGDDPAKAGFAPDALPAALERVEALEGLACEGLMTMPPLEADPRPLFAALREARDQLRPRFPSLKHLSMGMSKDFEVAVEEGATIVRVGEAVFGARPRPA